MNFMNSSINECFRCCIKVSYCFFKALKSLFPNNYCLL